MVANKFALSSKLRKKVPPLIVGMFLSQRLFFTWLGIAFSAFILFGPVVGQPDHNGYLYLIGPFVGPIVPALYSILRPFNPYRGPGARFGRMEYRDKSDPEAKRLVEVYRSKEARQFIWRSAAKVAGIVFLIMVILTLVVRNSLNWSFPSPGLAPGLLGGCLGSFLALSTEYIAWGLRTWTGQESR